MFSNHFELKFEGDFMQNKMYRLREFIDPRDEHSLIVDASAGLSLGPLPGLEQFKPAVKPVLPLVDGLVTSPGLAGKLAGRTRSDAALLVRADWTNALRGADFVLPPETINHIPLLTPEDALDLGASALVVYFLLGFEEQIEAGCLRNTVQLALEGAKVGMPLIVDVQAIGPRVVLGEKAIELGVSYALEGGADGVVVPWSNRESFQTILAMAAEVPVWVKPSTLEAFDSELGDALQMGGTGLWLDQQIFDEEDVSGTLGFIGRQIHPLEASE
jgi:DhnA family fructose-bisphosphate aldolase class Ia